MRDFKAKLPESQNSKKEGISPVLSWPDGYSNRGSNVIFSFLMRRLYCKSHNSTSVFSNWRRWDWSCKGSDAPAGHVQAGSWNAVSRKLTRQVYKGLLLKEKETDILKHSKSFSSSDEGLWLWNCAAQALVVVFILVFWEQPRGWSHPSQGAMICSDQLQ